MGMDVLSFHSLLQRKKKLGTLFHKNRDKAGFFQPLLIWSIKPNAHFSNVTRKPYYFSFTFSMHFKNEGHCFSRKVHY